MTNISINLKKAYIFTTNQGKKIEIDAYFEEEAIIEFQKNHQRVGPKYYHPVVFTKIEEVKPEKVEAKREIKRRLKRLSESLDRQQVSIDKLKKAVKKSTGKDL
jgi:hypothetical protein